MTARRTEPLVLPAYEDLPLLPGVGIPHSWEVFGRADDLGTLNLLDDATVLSALREAETGERVGLSLDPAVIDPPLYGREPLQHTIVQLDRNIWDDRLDGFYPQAASQWDGFRHVRCRELGFFTGVTEDPPDMGDRLSIHHWADQGIVGRGILLDVERYLARTDPPYNALQEVSVDAALLAAVASDQGVEIRRGDVLCIRFGWVTAYDRLDQEGRRGYGAAEGSPPFAGLAADESMARALWNWQVAAVACDNPGAEVSPGSTAVGSLHRRLIPTLGLVVGELLDFDRLAERCAEDGRWTFLFTAVPLNTRGGLGSPANAVAIR
jgi:kynurenine formamidase